MKTHIFIETGLSDAKRSAKQYTNEWYFVQQYILHLFPELSGDDFDIIDVGGKDKLRFFDNQMRDYALREDKCQVIFDCDEASIGGGVENRKAGFEAMKQELGLYLRLFLVPKQP